jgi:hypothetical protein
VVPSPNVAAENVLTGVAAYSENDVWAVGYAVTGSRYAPLILHFNGTAWTVWSEPVLDTDDFEWWNARLTGVQILTRGGGTDRQAVAVGYEESMHGPLPLVMHYDGATWKLLSLPPSMSFGRLFAVAGDSLDDLWAVGTLVAPDGTEAPYLFHRTAEGWTPVARGAGTLTSLAVVGDRVFTVGHVQHAASIAPLAMAYTIGTGDWLQVKAFNKAATDGFLTGIATGAGKLYAVGYTRYPGAKTATETLVLAYNGMSFMPVESPSPDQVNELYGAVVHSGVLWAVGTTGHEQQRSTLVLTNDCMSTR